MANYEFAASSARPTLAVSQLSLGGWLLSSLGGNPSSKAGRIEIRRGLNGHLCWRMEAISGRLFQPLMVLVN